ncbi:response regulator transcription factor [Paenibacillus cremeus]|uniref:Response regulator transcription factor n=1 Tax=Paenibacillus cremeus TaxID=2163881 RepID=A0A559K9J7_9BACL|nr:response regulator transcription factor [Paenibacillus cremeus]TVY08805.1 response regulator transcription factor [Paenibacillus cremeus]
MKVLLTTHGQNLIEKMHKTVGLQVVGFAQKLDELFNIIILNQPDVIIFNEAIAYTIVDNSLVLQNEPIKKLREEFPQIKVIIIGLSHIPMKDKTAKIEFLNKMNIYDIFLNRYIIDDVISATMKRE